MRRTDLLQEIRKMRFEEAYEGWQQGRLTQCESAILLGVSERTFRRYGVRYSDEGREGLIDQRLEQVSHRRARVDEVMRVTERYRARHAGWSAKHYFAWYRREGGERSYTWVKSRLQESGLVVLTCSPELVPSRFRVRFDGEADNEKAIHGRINHRGAARSGGRREGRRATAQTRHQ